jgi:drug/metabolite transporter (DMT)-like permease
VSLSDTNPSRTPASSFGTVDFGLYAATIFAWSTSWLALKWQVGVVDPQVSLVWRFSLAACLMLALCKLRGQPLRFPLRLHLRFAAMGVLLFSTNFLLFYYAAYGLVSGLLSVIFSTASVTNILMNTLVLRQPLRPRVAFGALLGIAGIACLFWPEISDQVSAHALGGPALIGLGLGVAGTLCFSAGNMISASIQKGGVPVFSANAIGMVYGSINCLIISLIAGSEFIFEPTLRYVGSLFWLVGISTVMAFYAYLTLLGRIGADKAGYATVIFPVFALVISAVMEGYQWSALSFAGMALVAIGNIIILSRPKPRVKPRQPMI